MNTNTYHPAAHVLDRLNQVSLVAVVGPTSVGKTTMMEGASAMHPGIHIVGNDTSRAPRPGEEEGKSYYFKTRDEMEAKIALGDYVQVAPTLYGDLYATAPGGYSASGVSVLVVLAEAVSSFRALPFKSLRAVFVIPSSWDEWQRRLKSHGFPPGQLERRLQEAKRSLYFALEEKEVHFVISDTVEQSVDDFATLLLDGHLSERLQADQVRAGALVKDFLDKLEK